MGYHVNLTISIPQRLLPALVIGRSDGGEDESAPIARSSPAPVIHKPSGRPR